MSYRTTLILLAILVVVGGAVYWQDIRPGPKKEEPKATQVFDIKPEDISFVKVDYEGKSTELRKEGDSKWKLTEPQEAEADYWYVEGLVSRLGRLNANRALTETTGDIAVYGLNQPAVVASIGTTDTTKIDRLVVGDKSPDGSAYYAKREGSDTIYLVSTSLISDVIKVVTNPPKATPTPTPAPTEAPTATPTPGEAAPMATPAG